MPRSMPFLLWLQVYHPYRQPETTNHCLPLNGRCSHICLPAPQFTKRSAKTACFCPDGMRIGKDNLNCEIDRKFGLTYNQLTIQL